MRQNSVQISGFVCKLEVHQFANSAVCRFNLGISRIEKKGEESVTNTAYLPVEVWKADASDFASLTKGANVELTEKHTIADEKYWSGPIVFPYLLESILFFLLEPDPSE